MIPNPLYRKNLSATGDTTRSYSPQLWYDCPTREQVLSRGGQWFEDDFTMIGNADASGGAFKGSIGQWSSYMDQGALIQNGQDTSGTVADADGGWITIGSDGDNEGVTLFSSAAGFRFMTANSTSAPGYQAKMWFEARISRSTIAATKIDAFVGLCTPILSTGLAQAALPITTTINVLSTTPSFFGFFSSGSSAGTPGGPTEIAVAFNKASGTVNFPTNLTSCMGATSQTVLAAGTAVKVGFLFDPAAASRAISSATARQTAGVVRRQLIRIFINGIECPAFLSSDDLANATSGQAFPIGFMCPTIAVMNDAGTSPGTLSIDRIKCVQLPNS